MPDLRREPGRTRPFTLLLFLLALPMLQLACEAAAPPVTPSHAPSLSRPEPPSPPSPTYQTLDGRFHYYAVTRLDEIADHFFVTFHDAEGAYCRVARAPGRPVVVEGCGFPATGLPADAVPDDRAFVLPAMRDALCRQEPGAANIRVRFDGAYRSVNREEEVPCDGAHGHGYNNVELRFDERLEKLQEVRYLRGARRAGRRRSTGRALPRGGCPSRPRGRCSTWRMRTRRLPPDLTGSFAELFANRADGTRPPAVP